LTLDALKGHWLRNGDRNHRWTVVEDGHCLFNGRYAGPHYNFREGVTDEGEREIFVEVHRSNGEEVDLSQSTASRIVWIKAESKEFSAEWRRVPQAEQTPAPPSSGLSATAAVFVPGRAFGSGMSAHATVFEPAAAAAAVATEAAAAAVVASAAAAAAAGESAVEQPSFNAGAPAFMPSEAEVVAGASGHNLSDTAAIAASATTSARDSQMTWLKDGYHASQAPCPEAVDDAASWPAMVLQ